MTLCAIKIFSTTARLIGQDDKEWRPCAGRKWRSCSSSWAARSLREAESSEQWRAALCSALYLPPVCSAQTAAHAKEAHKSLELAANMFIIIEFFPIFLSIFVDLCPFFPISSHFFSTFSSATEQPPDAAHFSPAFLHSKVPLSGLKLNSRERTKRTLHTVCGANLHSSSLQSVFTARLCRASLHSGQRGEAKLQKLHKLQKLLKFFHKFFIKLLHTIAQKVKSSPLAQPESLSGKRVARSTG